MGSACWVMAVCRAAWRNLKGKMCEIKQRLPSVGRQWAAVLLSNQRVCVCVTEWPSLHTRLWVYVCMGWYPPYDRHSVLWGNPSQPSS